VLEWRSGLAGQDSQFEVAHVLEARFFREQQLELFEACRGLQQQRDRQQRRQRERPCVTAAYLA